MVGRPEGREIRSRGAAYNPLGADRPPARINRRAACEWPKPACKRRRANGGRQSVDATGGRLPGDRDSPSRRPDETTSGCGRERRQQKRSGRKVRGRNNHCLPVGGDAETEGYRTKKTLPLQSRIRRTNMRVSSREVQGKDGWNIKFEPLEHLDLPLWRNSSGIFCKSVLRKRAAIRSRDCVREASYDRSASSAARWRISRCSSVRSVGMVTSIST